MAANSALTITGLDFDSIRLNLRNFLAGRPEFVDFDFEDSAIGTLLDLLSYNTYYMSFYANMAANESFLDTAQIYENVASRAKMLGYIPLSARGASANVKITFNTAIANATFRTITIPKNTQFKSTINSVSYTFVTPKSYSIAANSSNRFFGYIDVVEGTPLTHRFLFTAANTSFVLPNANTDTSSLSVTVTTSGNTQTYTEISDLKSVNSSSQVFFIEPDRNKLYKVGFGDNILGKKPAYNSTVTVSYRVSNGVRANGANNFTAMGSVGGQTSFTLTTIERATGGAEIESIESIRYNAPRTYETQNRAVTAEDYRRIVLRDNPDISGASVWGGEENDPPIYGKVFMALTARQGTLISTRRKNQIRSELRKYIVQAIDTEIVDPTYLYVVPTVTVRYDPIDTTLSASEIGALVANKIIEYEATNLNRFDGKFRYSRFLDVIDSASTSIKSTTADISVQKRFIPSLTSKNTYKLTFNRGIFHPNDGYVSAVSSNAFTYEGYTSYFDDDGYGNVRIYYLSNAQRNYIQTIGTIDYDIGLITLNAFKPDAINGEINITVKLADYNVYPIRNQILLLTESRVKVLNDISSREEFLTSSISTVGTTTTFNSSALSPITVY
jgi:hypothetical protein